ncbi:MAG: hypothetical protein ACREXY_06485 [Gammaproteobacteria bacterium]
MSEIMLIALGAALMYFFDPGSGRQRRAWLRDQWDRLAKKGMAAAPTTATAPRYTAAEQSVAEPTDKAAAAPTDEALGARRQGGEIAEEPGDAAKNVQPDMYKHE